MIFILMSVNCANVSSKKQSKRVANAAGCREKTLKKEKKMNKNKCHALVKSARALAGMQGVTAQ